MGSVVGLVGGSARRGQSHGSEVARLTSPSVGNLSEIMPRSTQAVRDRNIRSEVSVTYAIWRVSNLRASLLLPANLMTAAPRIRMPSLFAAFMVMDTGMRSSVLRPICWATLTPIRQLWHPVSAMAGRVTVRVRFRRAIINHFNPKIESYAAVNHISQLSEEQDNKLSYNLLPKSSSSDPPINLRNEEQNLALQEPSTQDEPSVRSISLNSRELWRPSGERSTWSWGVRPFILALKTLDLLHPDSPCQLNAGKPQDLRHSATYLFLRQLGDVVHGSTEPDYNR
ncbi:hypothetical protein CRUP_003021 [Coryphaenoides rupestris]|nr:hypothetical protein CRUP_003021 [Coryphaenoides rupestris]